MEPSKVTIQLTADQQKQIKNATGKSIQALHIDMATTGELTEKELGRAAGGIDYVKYLSY